MSVRFRVGVGMRPLTRKVTVERKTLCVVMVDQGAIGRHHNCRHEQQAGGDGSANPDR